MTSPSPNYSMRQGSSLDRALLVKFMQRTYQELFPDSSPDYVVQIVAQYFSSDTPLWWMDMATTSEAVSAGEDQLLSQPTVRPQPIGCVWVGTSTNLEGERQAYVFLLYVSPSHRRQGLGRALMQQAEAWAQQRGDRQIGLQVFAKNQAAIALYQQLGYQVQSLWLVKPVGATK